MPGDPFARVVSTAASPPARCRTRQRAPRTAPRPLPRTWPDPTPRALLSSPYARDRSARIAQSRSTGSAQQSQSEAARARARFTFHNDTHDFWRRKHHGHDLPPSLHRQHSLRHDTRLRAPTHILLEGRLVIVEPDARLPTACPLASLATGTDHSRPHTAAHSRKRRRAALEPLARATGRPLARLPAPAPAAPTWRIHFLSGHSFLL
jgi:hypothetical protein